MKIFCIFLIKCLVSIQKTIIFAPSKQLKTKTIMKKNDFVKVVIAVAVVVFGAVICSSAKSGVKYLDTPCPVCGGSEVGDYGHSDSMGGEHGHCFDCGCEFYVED